MGRWNMRSTRLSRSRPTSTALAFPVPVGAEVGREDVRVLTLPLASRAVCVLLRTAVDDDDGDGGGKRDWGCAETSRF